MSKPITPMLPHGVSTSRCSLVKLLSAQRLMLLAQYCLQRRWPPNHFPRWSPAWPIRLSEMVTRMAHPPSGGVRTTSDSRGADVADPQRGASSNASTTQEQPMTTRRTLAVIAAAGLASVAGLATASGASAH